MRNVKHHSAGCAVIRIPGDAERIGVSADGQRAISIGIYDPSHMRITVSLGIRRYTNTASHGNAYEVLGVARNSTEAEIKTAFRKLAKETHPDLHVDADSVSDRFVQILAAYEILSDPQKRARYDAHLLFQVNMAEGNFDKDLDRSKRDTKSDEGYRAKQMEVVEWLKWYRCMVNDIVSHKEIGAGSGLQEYLRGEVYSAIRAAYFGPSIDSTHVLPDCFEAEERSEIGILEVLHLVSGRHLFGIVCFADRRFMLSNESFPGVPYLQSLTMQTHASIEQPHMYKKMKISDQHGFSKKNAGVLNCHDDKQQIQRGSEFLEIVGSDPYKDLELHLFGKAVARATRVPPKPSYGSTQEKDSQDCISVFLDIDQDLSNANLSFTSSSESEIHSSAPRRVLVGTIYGLGTAPPESACFVYGADGRKTHMIMQHRTLFVKHMHWYQVGKEDATLVCECRCSRARLPPSKFWIFEPRCEQHSIGGWYVETFGRGKPGRPSHSKRHWQSLNADVCSEFVGRSSKESSERTLHPAMYIMALAYRTLDLEAAQNKKTFVGGIFKNNLDLRTMASTILIWCKRKLTSIKRF